MPTDPEKGVPSPEDMGAITPEEIKTPEWVDASKHEGFDEVKESHEGKILSVDELTDVAMEHFFHYDIRAFEKGKDNSAEFSRRQVLIGKFIENTEDLESFLVEARQAIHGALERIYADLSPSDWETYCKASNLLRFRLDKGLSSVGFDKGLFGTVSGGLAESLEDLTKTIIENSKIQIDYNRNVS